MLWSGFPVLFLQLGLQVGKRQAPAVAEQRQSVIITWAARWSWQCRDVPRAAHSIQKRLSAALQRSHPNALAFKALFRALRIVKL